MMPEMTLLCGTREYICTTVSVKMYRKYMEIMEHSEDADNLQTVFYLNNEILKAVFHISLQEIHKADITEQLISIKTIHFIMQEIITEKFLALNPEFQEQETETSAFDEYDEENGYNEDIKVLNIWAVCKENIDRIVKLCVRAFNDSYTKCMEADIMSLLDYLKFEISTINET